MREAGSIEWRSLKHSFRRHAGAECRYDRLSHQGEKRVAWWKIYQLHMGYAGADGAEGKNRRRR